MCACCRLLRSGQDDRSHARQGGVVRSNVDLNGSVRPKACLQLILPGRQDADPSKASLPCTSNDHQVQTSTVVTDYSTRGECISDQALDARFQPRGPSGFDSVGVSNASQSVFMGRTPDHFDPGTSAVPAP